MKSVWLVALLCAVTLAQKAPSNCYAQSRTNYGVDGAHVFSNKQEIEKFVNANHRLAMLTGCRSTGQRLNRLTIDLEDTKT